MATDFDYSSSGVITPIRDHIIVIDMDDEEEKVINGIIHLNETGSDRGIHPRQALVCAIGPDQVDVDVGTWILIEHGRWTRGVKLSDGKVYRKVDPDSILGIYDGDPTNVQSGSSSHITETSRHNMGGFE